MRPSTEAPASGRMRYLVDRQGCERLIPGARTYSGAVVRSRYVKKPPIDRLVISPTKCVLAQRGNDIEVERAECREIVVTRVRTVFALYTSIQFVAPAQRELLPLFIPVLSRRVIAALRSDGWPVVDADARLPLLVRIAQKVARRRAGN